MHPNEAIGMKLEHLWMREFGGDGFWLEMLDEVVGILVIEEVVRSHVIEECSIHFEHQYQFLVLRIQLSYPLLSLLSTIDKSLGQLLIGQELDQVEYLSSIGLNTGFRELPYLLNKITKPIAYVFALVLQFLLAHQFMIDSDGFFGGLFFRESDCPDRGFSP